MANSPMLDRLTASDIFLLLWEDYGWSTDIGGLAILDGASLLDLDGRLRIGAIRRRLEPRLQFVPRLRQLLVRPRLGRGWPLWVDAPSFDIANHVRVRAVPAPGDEAQLLETCEDLVAQRLESRRPLWELWLLPGLPEQRVGALLRLHHAVADGGAALATFGALLDLAADAPAPAPVTWHAASAPTQTELLRDNVRRRGNELRRAAEAIAHPRATVHGVRRTLPAWWEVLAEHPAPHTSLNRQVGLDRRLAIVRQSLEVTKQVGHAHNAKVNDVVLAAVAGGLRSLLTARRERVEGLIQRAMVTISLHDEQTGQALGNKPGWMMVPLPVGEPDAVRRLQLIAAETAARKNKARPEAGTGIFRFTAGQRVWYRMFPRQRSVNLVVTNVAGPPVPLYLAGAQLLEMFPIMPVMGNLTLVLAALSYAGQLNLTASADRDGCPDLDVFIDGVRRAFDDLARGVRAPATLSAEATVTATGVSERPRARETATQM